MQPLGDKHQNTFLLCVIHSETVRWCCHEYDGCRSVEGPQSEMRSGQVENRGVFGALRSCSAQMWTNQNGAVMSCHVAGNSRCVQGTGGDSELWLTFPGEVVKSADSEVILGVAFSCICVSTHTRVCVLGGDARQTEASFQSSLYRPCSHSAGKHPLEHKNTTTSCF